MPSGADIVNYAAAQEGKPYVFGATGPNSFDCSGLVQYVFRHFGIKTPRIADQQQNFGTPIGWDKKQPGDLLFFNWSGGHDAGHVGIYAGNNKMIEAPHSGANVRVVTLNSYYRANNVGVRRFPGVNGGPASIGDVIASGLQGLGIGMGIPGAADGLPGVGDIAGALSGIRDGIAGIASGVGEVGKVAEMVTHLFLPSNILRGFAMFFGLIFLLLGILFLTREVRNA